MSRFLVSEKKGIIIFTYSKDHKNDNLFRKFLVVEKNLKYIYYKKLLHEINWLVFLKFFR